MLGHSPLFQLYLTRIREFYRQPARLFWVYGFPTVLAVMLSLAFTNRAPDPVPVDLVESGSASEVAAKIEAFQKAHPTREGQAPLRVSLIGREAAERRLKTGRSTAMVEVDSSSSATPAVRYTYDPTRADAVAARDLFDDVYQRALGRQDVASASESLVTEKGSRYIDRLIPGLIGVNVMGGGMWGIGFLLVNFRIGKLLKRFQATPMPRRDFLLALFGARLTFLLPDLAILLSLGVFGFGMPVRGSLLVIVLVTVAGALAFAGIGMLVASRAQTTETVSGLMNLVMIPMWLFSGVFFSSERFPAAMQPFIKALPLTQIVDGLRAVILEGAGLVDVAPQVLGLFAWAGVAFVIALRFFRWS